MIKQASPEFQDVLTLALQLSPSERLVMIEQLAASFRQEISKSLSGTEEAPPFTPDEIAELTRVELLSPAEVIAQGLLGTWAAMNIPDGAEWVNERKRQRKERRKWSMP